MTEPHIFTHSSFRPRFLFNKTTLRALNLLTVHAVISFKKPMYVQLRYIQCVVFFGVRRYIHIHTYIHMCVHVCVCVCTHVFTHHKCTRVSRTFLLIRKIIKLLTTSQKLSPSNSVYFLRHVEKRKIKTRRTEIPIPDYAYVYTYATYIHKEKKINFNDI